MNSQLFKNRSRGDVASRPPGAPLSNEALRAALDLLLQGYMYSQECGRSEWDFAVDIQVMRDLHLRDNDLRWLVCMHLAEHAREVTHRGTPGRAFRDHGRLAFDKSSCFVLTPQGVSAALSNKHLAGSGRSAARVTFALPPAPRPDHPVPFWDKQRRELTYNGKLVKRFKLKSPNQDSVLTAFQEEGWPPRIDDPLPASSDLNPKQRLQQTIRSLNRKQKCRLVLFMGDGTGEGIRWELVRGKSTDRSE